MRKIMIGVLIVGSLSSAFAQQVKPLAENLIVVTMDGVRWKEVFQGADSVILNNPKFRKSYTNMYSGKFRGKTTEERRKKLMPFMWSTIAKKGKIYGNREIGNMVSVSNPYNVSYPGYSTIFTGYGDPTIKSNDTLHNPNTNVFEYINKQPGFQGKVASFASWNRAPYYLNQKRSGLMVNGGYAKVEGNSLSSLQQTLNSLQAQLNTGDHSRPDYITYLHAKEYLRLTKPRVLSIGLAWTDDAAHDGSYPIFLENIFNFDSMIADLWSFIENDPDYKGKTALMITVDHGRGYEEKWTSHGPGVPNSNEMWFAIMGPGIKAEGEVGTRGEFHQNQLAQTMARILGLTFKSENKVGEALDLTN